MTPKYQFAEIPQNDEGKEFIRLARKYLNKDRYDLRVRGQHLKAGLDWRRHQYGSSIADSSHYRVYISDSQQYQMEQELDRLLYRD
jgi:hypothetical protein